MSNKETSPVVPLTCHWHLHKYPISHSQYVFYGLTFISVGEGDDGRVSDEKAVKPVTAVCGDRSRYFKPKHDLFLTLSNWLLCLNLKSLKNSLNIREGFAEIYIVNVYSGDKKEKKRNSPRL